MVKKTSLLFYFILLCFSFQSVSSVSQITSLTADRVGFESIDLSWTSSQDLNDWNYRVFRDNVEVGVVVNSDTFTDLNLDEDTLYSYSIQAFSNSVTEDQSNSISLTTYTDPREYPLFRTEDLDYEGAYRLNIKTYGAGSLAFTSTRIAYNYDNHSLFISGRDGIIGEFGILDFIDSPLVTDLEITPPPIQYFRDIIDRTKTGNTQGSDRLTGLYYNEGEVFANWVKWYDGNADNTHTTIIVRDSSDIQNSEVDGFFELGGEAKGSGWIVPIPEEWQNLFNGDHINGYSSVDSIISRYSVGPSAYVFSIEDFKNKSSGMIVSEPALSYPYPYKMKNSDHFRIPSPTGNEILYNYEGGGIECVGHDQDVVCTHNQSKVFENDLWTMISKGQYGFIVPGTRTYAVFGSSGGHNTGLGYKIKTSTGRLCPGACTYYSNDTYNYYWLFDLNEMIDVRNGLVDSWDLRPYDYGVIETPYDYVTGRAFNEDRAVRGKIEGGAYNYEDNMLYFTMPRVDFYQNRYNVAPLILGYSLDVDVDRGDDPPRVPVLSSFSSPSQSENSIYLNWDYDHDQNVTTYLVFRDSINILNTSNSFFNDTSLSSDTEYTYSIQAYVSPEISSFISEDLVVETLGSVQVSPPLEVVSNVLVIEGNTSLYLFWTHPENGLVEYDIYDRISLLGSTSSPFYNHSGLIPNTTYYYSIDVSLDGVSNLSSEFSFRTLESFFGNNSAPGNNSEGGNDDGNDDDGNDDSGGSSGGGSSGGSSSNPPSRIQIPQGTLGIEDKVCQSLFTYTSWSECISGKQTRVRSDDNLCLPDSIQTRICELGGNEDNLIYLNAIELLIEKAEERFYLSSFISGTEFFFDEEDLGTSFIVYNKEEDLDYLARKIETTDSLNYYSLEVIDQELLESGTLEREELVQRSVLDVTQENLDDALSSSQFPIFATVILTLLFLSFLMFLAFYIKKKKKTQLLSTISQANSKPKELVSSGFSHSDVNKYSGYIKEINTYVSSHPNVPKLELKKNLERVGWNKEILDIVFSKKSKNL